MTPDELLAIWGGLATPDTTEHLEARELAPASGVWAAVDFAGTHHVLIEVTDDADAPPTTTQGLHVSARRHSVSGRGDATYLDLVCQAPTLVPTFAAVAADIADEIAAENPHRRPDMVAEALNRWRWFWHVSPDVLSPTDVVGLLAELWFLLRWAGCNQRSVDAWTASSGSRHDFQWSDVSVEVKGSSRRHEGGVVHHIQHLDQLADPETGQLLLFSLHVVRDSLAANTLPGVVGQIVELLTTAPGLLAEFLRKLGQRGYSPAYAERYATRYRILAESLFRVEGAFPRLTPDSFPGGLPAGVTNVGYDLDLAACEAWKLDAKPSDWRQS